MCMPPNLDEDLSSVVEKEAHAVVSKDESELQPSVMSINILNVVY